MNFRNMLIMLFLCLFFFIATACCTDFEQSKPTFSSSAEPESHTQLSQTSRVETPKETDTVQFTKASEQPKEPVLDFKEAQKIIESYFLGEWEEEFGKKFTIGISDGSNRNDFFDQHGILQNAYLTDTSAVIVCQNYISDCFRIVIDFSNPDTLLYSEVNKKPEEDYEKRYTRIGCASMYSDVGIMNHYLTSMLYHCYEYIDLSTDIGAYSTDPVYFHAENVEKSCTILLNHSEKKINFVSSFMPMTEQCGESIVWIRYTKIKEDEGWVLADWSYTDFESVKEINQKYCFPIRE